MVLGYVLSWAMNFFLINAVLGIMEEVYRYDVESHPRFLEFCMFIVPTLLEVIAFYEVGKPFFGALLPWFWLS